MKKKQKIDIRSKNKTEILSEIDKMQAEIYQLQVDIKLGKIKNTSLLRVKKDQLSVLKTILIEKKWEGEKNEDV